ncbi:hypothetical protein [Streptomyces sp. WAC06614]|uniref:hypothetical protein n=1 Tax=Streptomyces sp. WAC06614 TaxID=2487416 RepID=UPI000F7AC020|nr:hypothetical protein [Streptomyces sp. WAC06614]RSS78650.1 hypothetical protein EF918_20145 [Streptomyces sp. WAC06614]
MLTIGELDLPAPLTEPGWDASFRFDVEPPEKWEELTASPYAGLSLGLAFSLYCWHYRSRCEPPWEPSGHEEHFHVLPLDLPDGGAPSVRSVMGATAEQLAEVYGYFRVAAMRHAYVAETRRLDEAVRALAPEPAAEQEEVDPPHVPVDSPRPKVADPAAEQEEADPPHVPVDSPRPEVDLLDEWTVIGVETPEEAEQRRLLEEGWTFLVDSPSRNARYTVDMAGDPSYQELNRSRHIASWGRNLPRTSPVSQAEFCRAVLVNAADITFLGKVLRAHTVYRHARYVLKKGLQREVVAGTGKSPVWAKYCAAKRVDKNAQTALHRIFTNPQLEKVVSKLVAVKVDAKERELLAKELAG